MLARRARTSVQRARELVGGIDDEPVIYRAEVLTLMAVIRDIRHHLEPLVDLFEDDDGEEEETEAD